ncbi:hypothetical protein IscW_ISCW022543 [Ixodes scapularis]|uniref:Uncharacterized protein n=1 Tax=Ixodes scapularis TaxID=6945 RepID=B7QAN5_IXOSC|nr:hypothetical protein IscW_ISCW022543 [Ixodes scapularis]|eukprot:XP_002412611.1 hypothetical protein IscW_ISCW022543 [Ixodes scapularis]
MSRQSVVFPSYAPQECAKAFWLEVCKEGNIPFQKFCAISWFKYHCNFLHTNGSKNGSISLGTVNFVHHWQTEMCSLPYISFSNSSLLVTKKLPVLPKRRPEQSLR